MTPFELKTHLLKESDLLEDGSPKRFMVWDNLAGRLTYFDSETGFWEGENGRSRRPGRKLRRRISRLASIKVLSLILLRSTLK